MDNILNILLGAGIASIVPLVTLFLNNQRWKKEKLVEHLRIKYNRMDQLYLEINEGLPSALVDNSYPSKITSLIFTHGSENVKSVFTEHIKNKDKTLALNQQFIFNMSKATNQHLLAIEKEIEDMLS
ncbi:hypothetical protein AB4122_08700 [Vibrio cyclitrophicus]